jgi:hypothetical protein
MENSDLENLVTHAAELRQQLEGRTPEYVRFYFREWMLGTAHMTDEEAGIYIRLLCQQLDKGQAPLNGTQPAAVSHKFIGYQGRHYNLRGLFEWIASARELLGARKRGKASAESRRRKDTGSTF